MCRFYQLSSNAGILDGRHLLNVLLLLLEYCIHHNADVGELDVNTESTTFISSLSERSRFPPPPAYKVHR